MKGVRVMSPIENWRQLAAGKDDAEKLRRLGGYIFFVREQFTPDLIELARECMEKAAELGNCDAMLDLGGQYLLGRKLPQSREKAEYWYRQAEEKGGGAAKKWPKIWRCLGNFYLYDNLPDGTPVKTTDEMRLQKAHEYFKKGAAIAEPNALFELGDMYRCGICETQSDNLAFEYYDHASKEIKYRDDDSCSNVCLRLGDCYLHGIGTNTDLKLARKYLEAAVSGACRRLEDKDMYGGREYEQAKKLMADLEAVEGKKITE